jgi:hypothetical protein
MTSDPRTPIFDIRGYLLAAGVGVIAGAISATMWLVVIVFARMALS